jgi:hypothetical protein
MTTILAAFEDERTARAAAEQLAQAGVPHDDLHIETDLARLKTHERSKAVGNDSVLGSAGRLFADLVSTNVDHHHTSFVSSAMDRGATVLVARTTEPSVADTASALLRAAGAYDVSVGAAADLPH